MSGAHAVPRWVVCPTDFSGFAKSAFAEAVRISAACDARLTLLHVLPREVGERTYAPPPPERARERRRRGRDDLSELAATVPLASVELETVLAEGDVVHEIRRAALERGADLIVMGTRGRTGLGRLMFGSVTEAMIRHAPCPVLTVHRAVPRSFSVLRVLCAVDVSEWTPGTIEFATALYGATARAVTLLSVIEDPSVTPELTRAELIACIPDASLETCGIDVRIGFGRPAEDILAVAREEGSDVIVLGSHGRGDPGRLLFGSTVREVVRLAPCPVLVVPAGYALATTRAPALAFSGSTPSPCTGSFAG